MSLSRLSSHGIGPPPKITYSTPSCRIRRAAAGASSFEPPPARPASRQIFGVSFPSPLDAARGDPDPSTSAGSPRASSRGELVEGSKRSRRAGAADVDVGYVAGIPRAIPAVFRMVRREGLLVIRALLNEDARDVSSENQPC